MNRIIFISILLLISISSWSKILQNSFLLKGIILGEKPADSTTIEISYLTLIDGNYSKIIDSTKIINGRFVFMGEIKEPTAAILYIDNMSLRIYIEPKNMEIVFDRSEPYLYKLTGAKIEEEYTKLRKDLFVNEKISYNILNHIIESIDKHKNLEDSVLKENLKDSINNLIRQHILNRKIIDSIQLNFVSKYNTLQITPHLLFLLTDMEAVNIDTIRQIYNTMPKEIKNSLMGQIANIKIGEGEKKKLSDIGHIAPEFIKESSSGEIIKISDFKDKNYILLDFWASWCGPCLKAVPEMKDIYTKYNENGLLIIGVSLDKDKKSWLNAIEKHNLKLWPQILSKDIEIDNSKSDIDLSEVYNIGDGIPFYILINKQGEIIARWEWLGEEELLELNNIIIK